MRLLLWLINWFKQLSEDCGEFFFEPDLCMANCAGIYYSKGLSKKKEDAFDDDEFVTLVDMCIKHSSRCPKCGEDLLGQPYQCHRCGADFMWHKGSPNHCAICGFEEMGINEIT